MPTLAYVLILTAQNRSESHKWPGYFAAPLSDRALLVLTFTLTVVADLTVSISIGEALRLMRRNAPTADWATPER